VKVSEPREYKLIIEKDVQIPLRDGTVLYADLFRPDGGDERFPVIMNIGPYQKDRLWVPPPDLEEVQVARPTVKRALRRNSCNRFPACRALP
jgi:predicted acyl esterase